MLFERIHLRIVRHQLLKLWPRAQVYNRYGKVVYDSQDQNSGWDGAYSGKDQAMDTYAWVCSMRYILEGEEVTWIRRGDITLVR